MESTSIAGPPAFHLPQPLLDFLEGWEHDRLDLLDACRVPVGIAGKPNISTRGCFPKEIFKEKSKLQKKRSLDRLVLLPAQPNHDEKVEIRIHRCDVGDQGRRQCDNWSGARELGHQLGRRVEKTLSSAHFPRWAWNSSQPNPIMQPNPVSHLLSACWVLLQSR
jgi:hypothetical protein